MNKVKRILGKDLIEQYNITDAEAKELYQFLIFLRFKSLMSKPLFYLEMNLRHFI